MQYLNIVYGFVILHYLEILGHTFASKLLVVCRVINVHEFRESNDYLKSSYVQVTLANEYQHCFMEKLYLYLKTEQNKGLPR